MFHLKHLCKSFGNMYCLFPADTSNFVHTGSIVTDHMGDIREKWQTKDKCIHCTFVNITFKLMYAIINRYIDQ